MSKFLRSTIQGGAMLVVALLVMGAGCDLPLSSSPEPLPVEPLTGSLGAPMQSPWQFQGELPAERIQNKQVTIKTAKGDIVFELFADDAPITVSNFVYLAEEGYYNGLTFHRREEGFVIQGGDPSGNGTGGPGYKFEDEPVRRSYDKGIVAMANAGPDTNGSQFFIMLDDYPLPPLYTIFGKVTSGQEVVDKIQVGDVMSSVTVENKQ